MQSTLHYPAPRRMSFGLLMNDGKVFSLSAFALFTLIMAAHLALGTDPLVAYTALLSVLIGVAPLYLSNLNNPVSLILLFQVLEFIFLGAVVKLFYLAPLDSRLLAPLESHLAVAVGLSGFALAALVARIIPTGRSLFQPLTDVRILRAITLIAGSVAAIGWVLFLAKSTGIIASVGNFLRPLIYLALAAAIARRILTSKRQSSFDSTALLITAFVVLAGIITNSKQVFLTIMMVFGFTIIYYQGRVGWRSIALLLVFLLVAFQYIFPVIHEVRAIKHKIPADQLISETVEMAFRYMTDNTYRQQIKEGVEYREYLKSGFIYQINYISDGDSFSDRFILIQYFDPFVEAVQEQGFVGWTFWEERALNFLPAFLNPDKTLIAAGDEMSWIYGLRPFGQESHITISGIGSAYVVGGHLAVFLGTFILYSLIFIAIKKMFPSSSNNVWAIYFFALTAHKLVSGTLINNLFILTRVIPTNIVFMLLVLIAAQILVRSGRISR